MKPVFKKISSVITLIIILIMLVPLVQSTSTAVITDNFYNVKSTHFLNVHKNSVNVKKTKTHYLCHIKLMSKMEFYLFDMYTERFICLNETNGRGIARKQPGKFCELIDTRIGNTHINFKSGNRTLVFGKNKSESEFIVSSRKLPHLCPKVMKDYCSKKKVNGEKKHLRGKIRRFCNLLYPSSTKTKLP